MISADVTCDTTPGGNGHCYEFVRTSYLSTWTNTSLEAGLRTYKGKTGYLATITSQHEQDFISLLCPLNYHAVSWIGGQKASGGGVNIKWTTGSIESGQMFYSSGTCVSGKYCNVLGSMTSGNSLCVVHDQQQQWGLCTEQTTSSLPAIGFIVEYGMLYEMM